MISLRPEEHKILAAHIYSICSIALDNSKGYLIESRLGQLVEDTRSSSYGDLVARARQDSSGLLNRRIIDAITTNETSFFRDNSPFELLKYKIIPDLLDRRKRMSSTAPIRIWSAACSTGQEVYSIGIALKEVLGDLGRYNVRILGTDISDQAVARASKGIYGTIEISRGLPDSIRQTWFVPRGPDWQIRDEIRAMASFRTLNLMKDFSALGHFDVILCRNVAIYFTQADRIALFDRIGRALEPDGYLVVGAMESLSGVCPQFESKRHVRSVFYQLKSPLRK